MSTADLRREVVRLQVMLEDQMNAAPGIGESLEVDPIVRAQDGLPQINLRSGEVGWSWSCPQARMITLTLLDAAVEAERDAAVVAFLRDHDWDDDIVGGFLSALRDHRSEWLSKLTDGSYTVDPSSGERVSPEAPE